MVDIINTIIIAIKNIIIIMNMIIMAIVKRVD